ncbi:MAG: hypothetical protein OEY79_04905, partial [Anaplasmataceae bacterium]|nr:hypothetical protein [Anaplasmataceae bacterium]
EGTEGWINSRFLSNKRYIIILNNNINLYKNIFKFYQGVAHKHALMEYINNNHNGWCEVKYKSTSLFIKKQDVWGC